MSSLKFTLIFGAALAVTPFVACTAQGQDQPAAHTAPAAVIPPDQQASREQLIKLFTAMRLESQMDAFMKRVPQLIQQQVKAQTKQMAGSLPNGGTPTPEQQAKLDRISDEYMKRAMGIITMEQLEEDLIPIYQKHISATDVDALTTFYLSPAGQHLLDQQPAIMEEYMPVAIKRAQASSKQLTDDLARDLTAALKPPAAAPGGAPPK